MRQRVITSRSNPAIKRLCSLAGPQARRKSDTFLIEGPKFIRDALAAGMELVTLVVSEKCKVEVPDITPDTKLLRVSARLFKQLSGTASPQGLIAEAKRRWSKLAELTSSEKHLLVLWGLQDPGNVGTVVRSSAAFGMGGVIVSPDSADPFAPKAVRASAGTVLHHPLAKTKSLAELVANLRKAGYLTHWTGAQAQMALRDVARETLCAVFIGSEGRGFSHKDSRAIGSGIRIPIDPQVQSLNAGVVGSIAAYELGGII